MRADKPPTVKGLATAAQCLQNFSTEMQRVDSQAQADLSELDGPSSHKTFQQAPRDSRRSLGPARRQG